MESTDLTHLIVQSLLKVFVMLLRVLVNITRSLKNTKQQTQIGAKIVKLSCRMKNILFAFTLLFTMTGSQEIAQSHVQDVLKEEVEMFNEIIEEEVNLINGKIDNRNIQLARDVSLGHLAREIYRLMDGWTDEWKDR